MRRLSQPKRKIRVQDIEGPDKIPDWGIIIDYDDLMRLTAKYLSTNHLSKEEKEDYYQIRHQYYSGGTNLVRNFFTDDTESIERFRRKSGVGTIPRITMSL